MTIINAKDIVLGRLASVVSERLLKGESIQIVNAEKIIITGSKKFILKRFQTRFNLRVKHNPTKGPKFSRRPDLLVKRSIRGMLPYKKERGKNAFKRLRVFVGLPKEFETAKLESLEKVKHKGSKNFIQVGELSKLLGAGF